MKTVSKTYIQIIQFVESAAVYLKDKKDKENKLCHAIRKQLKSFEGIIESYNDKVTDLRLDYCAVDEKTKIILKDTTGNLQFTVDQQKQLNAKLSELRKSQVVISPEIITEDVEALVAGLSTLQKEDFAGIVIP